MSLYKWTTNLTTEQQSIIMDKLNKLPITSEKDYTNWGGILGAPMSFKTSWHNVFYKNYVEVWNEFFMKHLTTHQRKSTEEKIIYVHADRLEVIVSPEHKTVYWIGRTEKGFLVLMVYLA